MTRSITLPVARLGALTLFGLAMVVAASVASAGESASSAAAPAEPAAAPADPWAPLRPLLGKWSGDGTGMGGESTVEHEYRFILQDKFVRMTTLAVFERAKDGTPGERHEDLGVFSWDGERGRLVLRQFLTEGYVNRYVMEEPDASGILVFTSEASENGGEMRARLTWDLEGDDAYVSTLDLAMPGKDFFECRRMRLERKR